MAYKLEYDASPTCAEFIRSRAKQKILAGPVGGGKTSAAVMHVLTNALEQEPDNDGIRRTRHLIIRNTVPMLKTTTIKSFLDWIPDGVFGRWVSSDKTYYMKFDDVEAEVLFFPLEDVNDIRRLLSLETTTAFFNEFREISPDIVEGLIGTKRVGRYPSRKQGPGATYPCIIADTNMPAMDTWHQRVMDGVIPGWELHKQPGGRTPEVENLKFLPPDYYDIDGLTEEYVKTMIDCEYGDSKEGMPVFRSSFISAFHVAEEPLFAIQSPDHPLLIGLDAGLTPAAIIGQLTHAGRLNVLDECYTPKGESMGMERFLTTRLIPMLRNRFASSEAVVIVDPAAMQRSQANEETVFQIVDKSGLTVRTASSNKLELRIGSAETMFGRQVQGKAGLLIDAKCTGLINALKYGYKFGAKKDGEMEEKPLKDHPNSDLCFVAGTPVLTPNGWVRIENILPGDVVAVPGGLDVVTHTGSRYADKVVKVVLSDGTEVVCTPEHPFAIDTSSFLPADALYSGLELIQPKVASGTASMRRKSPLSVVRVEHMSGGRDVFNLTTRDTHVFYAAGVLVHNCDAFCYLTSYVAGPGIVGGSGRREIAVVNMSGWV